MMSTELGFVALSVPPMSAEAIERVREIEAHILATQFQPDLHMQHTIHGGVYTRTCTLPAGLVLTGALIKIPTTLIVHGECFIWLGGEGKRLTGCTILTASAGRKQAFRAITDTTITMIFPTKAKTVPECEREFTDEFSQLAPGTVEIVITGEIA